MIHKLFLHKYLKELAVLIIFTLTVAIFYGNTLQNGYIHDDHGQVEENTYIQSLKYLPKIITGCIWESAVGNCKETYYYRPLQSLSYMLTYQISSQPWVFHLINLIYFTVAVVLVFTLVKLLTKNFLIAFLSGFIFLIHPLNNEVVNWIATVPELLYTIFVLLGTIFYFLYRERKNAGYLMLVYVFFALGVFAKEPAVFVPFVWLALDFFYFHKSNNLPGKIATATAWLRNDKRKVWNNIKPYLICIIIFLIYMSLRFWVLGGLGQDPASKITNIQYIWTFFDLFASYIKKVIWPYPLNLFYVFNPSYRFLDIYFLANVLIVLGFLGACFVALKKRWFLGFFSLVWFLVFLAPSLIFTSSIGENLFAERHVFASTIGFAIIAAAGLNRIRNMKIPELEKKGDWIVAGILGIAFLGSLIIAYQRNLLWKTDESIYAQTLKFSPSADLIRYNLAHLYENGSKKELAKQQYGEIISRGSWIGLYKAYNNLGNIYRQEQNYEQAIFNYAAALKNNPLHKLARNNLGAMLFEKGDLLNSVTNLCKAISIDPNYQEGGNNFNMISSRIQSLDNQSFMKLSDQMLSGNVFKPAASVIPVKTGMTEGKNEMLKLEKKDCNYPQGCILIFSSKIPQNTFFFPFLTMGKTDNGEVVRSRYFEFNPQTSEIAIGIDREFESSNINFYIPTCEGVYYEGGSE